MQSQSFDSDYHRVVAVSVVRECRAHGTSIGLLFSLADVLIGIPVESLLAASGADVLGLTFLKRKIFRTLTVNAHSAYQIDS